MDMNDARALEKTSERSASIKTTKMSGSYEVERLLKDFEKEVKGKSHLGPGIAKRSVSQPCLRALVCSRLSRAGMPWIVVGNAVATNGMRDKWHTLQCAGARSCHADAAW